TLGVAFRANAVIGSPRSTATGQARRCSCPRRAGTTPIRARRRGRRQRRAGRGDPYAREPTLCQAGGNAGYRLGVRLALPFAILTVLAAPGAALAEVVPGASTNAVLAVAADGTPRVASESGGRLTIEARDANGAWSTVRAGALPGAGALREGIAGAPAAA